MSHQSLTAALCAALSLVGVASARAQGRDAAFDAGTIQYRRVDNGQRESERSGRLTWAKDGRYRHDVQDRTKDGKALARSFVLHPGWRYIETKIDDKTEVSFDDAGSWPLDEDPRFFVSAGPSRPLAGQLGNDDLKLVDVGSNGIPKRAERLIEGKVVNRWEYSGSINAGTIAVPAIARYEVPGHDDRRREFFIEAARLGHTPTEEDLVTEWFAPGKTVIDRRVDPLVTWTYEDLREASEGKKLTPESLLALSRKKSVGFARDHERKVVTAQSMERGQDQRMNLLMGIVGVGAATSMFGVWMTRRRKPVQ